jgi:hypothetical protein
MLITIKNRADVYNYRVPGFDASAVNATKPQAISYEFLLNTSMISTVKFYDNVDHPYSVKSVDEMKIEQTIVIGIGTDYEVLAFEESAAKEYKRIKRDLEVAFIDPMG